MIILQSSLHLADMLYSGHPFIAEKFSGTVQITVKALKNNFCISGTYIVDRVITDTYLRIKRQFRLYLMDTKQDLRVFLKRESTEHEKQKLFLLHTSIHHIFTAF